MTLRIYIAQQLRALEQLEGVSDQQIDEATEIIEATILETPDEIKQIENNQEKEKAFREYIKKSKYINKGTIQGIQHQENKGGTVNNHFGDTHNHPNQ